MNGFIDHALDEVLRRIAAGESLEQCLRDYAPDVASELRSMVKITSALSALRDVPRPLPHRVAANRARFLEQAAAYRDDLIAPRRGGIWAWVGSWLARPTFREAMTAATMTLVLGLLLLFGAVRGAKYLEMQETEPSATFVAFVVEMTTPPTGTGTAPAAPTPQLVESPTPIQPAVPFVVETPPVMPEATNPPATEAPLPVTPTLAVATSVPTPTPAAPLPTATLQPPTPKPTLIVTAPPSATPTPLPPLPTWTPTESPDRPTATSPRPLPTATPTTQPSIPPVQTRLPGPTLVLTMVPTATPTPPR